MELFTAIGVFALGFFFLKLFKSLVRKFLMLGFFLILALYSYASLV